MINLLCLMILHCQTHLARSMVTLINNVFFHVGFSTKAWYEFGRPKTWAVNIYICLGTSIIGWLDDKPTLPHDFALPDTSSNDCDYAHQQCVFPCWLLNKGMPLVWKATNMVTKYIYLCGNKDHFSWTATVRHQWLVLQWQSTWWEATNHHYWNKTWIDTSLLPLVQVQSIINNISEEAIQHQNSCGEILLHTMAKLYRMNELKMFTNTICVYNNYLTGILQYLSLWQG